MSLLDDARRLAQSDALRYIKWPNQAHDNACPPSECVVCHSRGEHLTDCPVPSLPKIAQALNAMEHAQAIFRRGRWAEARDAIDAAMRG